MPICERDPWRYQFFEGVACPEDVNVPTDDLDVYEWYPEFRWVYEKLKIAQSQNLLCGNTSNWPSKFPVFAKPNINLRGMGLHSGEINTAAEFEALPEGHMWMPFFTGEHISTDCAIIRGEVKWIRHALGFPWHRGMFTHWVIEIKQRPELNQFLRTWVESNLGNYTGMVNFETIGGYIIEAHLRFADQWCDIYGKPWIGAVVELYSSASWTLKDEDQKIGYSIPLFLKHGRVPPHPPEKLQKQIRAMTGISSLQITYFENRNHKDHPMPPGGFRLGLINAFDYEAGLAARDVLATGFEGCELLIPEKV
jgi:hypothetical protein